MRFNFQKKPKKPGPERGDTKIVSRFLWFPKSINKKVHWWECAIIRYEYRNPYGITGYWLAVAWVDVEDLPGG